MPIRLRGMSLSYPELEAQRLHGHLIGQQGSRRALNTPALILDLDALERNIAAMAAYARQQGVGLRPHSKMHKSPEFARRQMAAGALGQCCAKLGEAEMLAEAGVTGLHLTSAVVAPQGIERLLALNGKSRVTLCVDNPANVDVLAEAAAKAGQILALVVDIDPGIHRTGVVADGDVVGLARRIAARPSLRFAGVQFYSGRIQHVNSFAERAVVHAKEMARLAGIVAALTDAGLKPGMITGGGTGTHRLDAQARVFNELQVGSYAVMDKQYEDVDIDGTGKTLFEPALFVDTTVISANSPGMATLDAGMKAMATDSLPRVFAGAPGDAAYSFFGDEYGLLRFDAAQKLAIGAVISLFTPHCDPTINLYEAYHVVRGDTLIDIWPVAARGRSR